MQLNGAAMELLFGRARDPDSAVIQSLATSFHAGEYSLLVVPPYPKGYVQVTDHLPWERSSLLSVAVGLLILIGIRATMRLIMPRAGKALGEKLHGKTWLTSGHGSTLDWRRFADVCHFTLSHIALTCFVLLALLPEVASWVQSPEQWWSFYAAAAVQHAQNVLSPAAVRQPRVRVGDARQRGRRTRI